MVRVESVDVKNSGEGLHFKVEIVLLKARNAGILGVFSRIRNKRQIILSESDLVIQLRTVS